MDYYSCECITVTILEVTFVAPTAGSASEKVELPPGSAGSPNAKLPVCTTEVQKRLVAVLRYELDISEGNLSPMSCAGGPYTITLTLAYLSTNVSLLHERRTTALAMQCITCGIHCDSDTVLRVLQYPETLQHLQTVLCCHSRETTSGNVQYTQVLSAAVW